MPKVITKEQEENIKSLFKEFKCYWEISELTGHHIRTVRKVLYSSGLQREPIKIPVSELRGFLTTIQEAFEDLEKAGHLEADDQEQNDKIIAYFRSLVNKAHYLDTAYTNVTGAPVKPDLTPAFKVSKPKMTQHHHVLGGRNV